MINSRFLHGLMFLLIAQMMVALNIVATKFIIASMPIFFLLAMRFMLASLVLLPLHWLTPASQIPLWQHLKALHTKDWVFIIAQSLCAGFLFNLLMLLGLHYTSANAAGIITSALPATIVLLSLIVLREKFSRKKIGCVAFASIGLVTLTYGQLNGSGLTHSMFGDVIVLASLLPEATYYLLCQVYMSKLPIFILTSTLNGISAILFLIILSFTHWPAMQYSVFQWAILTILGTSSGLFYVFWLFGSKRVDTVLASLSTAIMPVATVIFAWLFLSESLTLGQLIGMGMIISSIVIYAKR